MSEKQLREMIDTASGFVDEMMKEEGHVEATWHAVREDGTPLFIPGPPIKDKDDLALVMRSLFKMQRVVRYVFWDEAWMVEGRSQPGESGAEIIKRVGPASEHPERIEIVLITGEDADSGVSLSGKRVIIRPPGGKPHLGPLVV
jgi:hypothetical protein